MLLIAQHHFFQKYLNEQHGPLKCQTANKSGGHVFNISSTFCPDI